MTRAIPFLHMHMCMYACVAAGGGLLLSAGLNSAGQLGHSQGSTNVHVSGACMHVAKTLPSFLQPAQSRADAVLGGTQPGRRL